MGAVPRNRKDNRPDNRDLLHKMALDPVRLEPSKGSTRGGLKRAGRVNSCLVALLCQVILLFQFTKNQMR